MKKILLNSLYVIAVLFSEPALTAPIISLDPHPQKVHLGENIFITINVSGLQSGGTNTLLAAFSMDVHFDSDIFQFLPGLSSFGSGLGDVGLGEALIGDSSPGSGILSLYELSLLEDSTSNCILCTGPYLEDLQGNSFTLANLAFYMPFDAKFSGTTSIFSTANVILSDPFGKEITNFSNPSTAVSVDEPTTTLLIIIGLILIIEKNYKHVFFYKR